MLRELFQKQGMKKSKKKELKEQKEEYKQNIFDKHINEELIDEGLEETIQFLSIVEEDDKVKYYNVINDKFLKEGYLNFIRFCSNDAVITKKIKNINDNNVEYKAIFSSYNNISLIHQLERAMNIERFQIEKIKEDRPLEVNEQLITKVNTAFRTEQRPNTYNEYIEYYVSKLNNIFGSLDIIKGERKQVNKKRSIHYSINLDALKNYFDLHYLSCPTRYTINPFILNKYKNQILFITEEEYREKHLVSTTDNDDDNDDEIIIKRVKPVYTNDDDDIIVINGVRIN